MYVLLVFISISLMVVKQVIQKTCKNLLLKIYIGQLFKELTINVY